MDNQQQKQQPCPFCGGTEFVVGKQDGQAQVMNAGKKLTFTGVSLMHIICTNCGTVVQSFTPELDKIRRWGN
ncbi:Lar family restriction alleviation protein [Lacticaseibacillus sharpeae]|nr:Lar family restriction alleviation protein [Lacticaseibacillus sharpeae]